MTSKSIATKKCRNKVSRQKRKPTANGQPKVVFNPANHITGKVYDLTQENFNAVLKSWEAAHEQVKSLQPIVKLAETELEALIAKRDLRIASLEENFDLSLKSHSKSVTQLCNTISAQSKRLTELEWFQAQVNKYVAPGETDTKDAALILVRKQAERITELEAKLTSQASSHGMYITQNLEPRMDELEADIAEKNLRIKELEASRDTKLELAIELLRVKEENAQLRETLELVAAPKRPDGTYNRSRESLEILAKEVLGSQISTKNCDNPILENTTQAGTVSTESNDE